MIKVVLFDLDGTLADTARDLTIALNHVLIEEGKPKLSYQTVRTYSARGSADLIRLGFGEDIEALKQKLLDFYLENIAVETKLFDGMEQVLATLSQKQIKFGVVTNKPQKFTIPLLQQLKIYPDCLVCGDMVKRPKPYPDSLLKACQLLQVTPKQTIFVGDAEFDAKAANSANMRIIVAKYGYLSENDNISEWNINGAIDNPIDFLSWIDG